MTVPLGAVAGRLSATAMRKSERAGERIAGTLEAGQEEASTAAKARGLGALRRGGAAIHLIVIIQSDNRKHKTLGKCFPAIRFRFGEHASVS